MGPPAEITAAAVKASRVHTTAAEAAATSAASAATSRKGFIGNYGSTCENESGQNDQSLA